MDAGALGGRVLRRHTLIRPEGLVECASVLDIGAGIRPFAWYTPGRHVCVEPYHVYADALRRGGYTVWQGTAQEALPRLRADAVLMLDVLEHMERETGARVLDLAKVAARQQIVVYTPNGFLEQEGDAWGLGGAHWQRHRSGWTPSDFPGWRIQHHQQSFFALWEA